VIPEWLDLLAVVVGAFAGVYVSREHDLDLVGHLAMCLICALGGGLLRDAIMQVGDVYMLRSYWAIPACVAVAVVGFCFPRLTSHFPNIYEWVDIVSVALFVIAGTDKAMAYDLHGSAVVLMGTITGVGGGMLRDVFLGEVPHVFQSSNFYAICALAGAAFLWFCVGVAGLDGTLCAAATVVVVVGLRRLSLHFGIYSHTGMELEDRLIDATEKVLSRKAEGQDGEEPTADERL